MVGCRRNRFSGQVLAETALILPTLLFLAGCMIQLAFLGYASCLARYAAFAGLRAAAVAPENRSPDRIAEMASRLIAKAPGLRIESLELAELSPGRAILNVRVQTPRLVPFFPDELNHAEGKCAMPLEPEW